MFFISLDQSGFAHIAHFGKFLHFCFTSLHVRYSHGIGLHRIGSFLWLRLSLDQITTDDGRFWKALKQ
jgi:hypothetical protein